MTDTTPPNAVNALSTDAKQAEEAKPKPTFDAIPLSAEVRRALDEMGYTHPTPVQIAVYDPIARGKDVKVQARTGTGKTAAFGLPIVDQLVKKSGGLQVLALCPTRELALQVAAEIAKLGKHKGVKVTAVYGGAPMGRQIAELEAGAQVVVGTPGRVLDHLRRGTMDPKAIRGFVLDEADEMLSMGFEKELNAIVERLPKSRQTMLFSATLSSDVGRLARSMNDPETIMLSGDQVGALELTHYFYLQRGDKIRDLLRLLEVEDPPSAICFCNTKDETERVARELRKAGYSADYLSGDLDQRERERVMAATREGKLRFLVATDVAARGIDITHCTHVINVDFPDSPEHYVHRTGRTGRAGRTGTAISLISAKDIGNLYYLRLTYGLRPIERSLPTEQELATRRESDLVEKVAQKTRERAVDLDARAIARRLLAHDDAEGLVAALLRDFLGSQLVAEGEAAKARRAKNPPPLTEMPPTTKSETPSARGKASPTPTPEPRTAEPAAPVDADAITSRQQHRERERAARPTRDAAPRDAAPREAAPREAAPPRDAARALPADGRPLRDIRDLRDARERRGGDVPHRAPHSKLAEWAPPAEADDETPIFVKEDAPPPAREAREARPRAREREPREAPREARPPREDRGAQGDVDRPDIGEVKTLFVNAGRRDGLRAGDLVRIITERAGIAEGTIGRVRVRDRNTFVDVKPDVADRALEAIKGAVVGSRTLNAEIARARDDGPPAEPGAGPIDERATLPMGSRR